MSSLTAEDFQRLSVIRRGNEWLRSALCTLARRGVAFRRKYPRRANELLESLATLPLYRGGQFLFDLMEWEDFMVEGPPAQPLANLLDQAALERLVNAFASLQAQLERSSANRPAANWKLISLASGFSDDGSLPALEPGFYLYQDVVVGLLMSVQVQVDVTLQS